MYCTAQRNFSCTFHHYREFPVRRSLAAASFGEANIAVRRRGALKRVDKELSNGNFKTALSLLKQLQQSKPDALRAFGSVKLIPKKVPSLDKLETHGMDLSHLQSVVDSVVGSIQKCIQFALLDQVSTDEPDNLVRYQDDGSLCEDDLLMYVQHEAGHFLVGYLLGVLPKDYKVPSREALEHDKFAESRVEFLGFEFLREVGKTKTLKQDSIKAAVRNKDGRSNISSKILNNFSCVILGGLVAEHLVFGYSEGLHSDVDKLDRVLNWVGFTKTEADAQVRWAAVNTVLILHHYNEARLRLAEGMAKGRSVGFCIDTIENAIHGKEFRRGRTTML